jgi:endonuclease G
MKPYQKLLPLLLLILLTASCDDDDKLPTAIVPETSHDNSTNTNRNPISENADYARLEFPHIRGDEGSVVLIRRVPNYGINYAIEYDRVKRSQRWTCWQWYRGNSGKAWDRNYWNNEKDNPWAMLNMRTYGWGDPFQPDPDLLLEERTELEEYYDIPYQRGHILASADRLNSKEANEQTFYLSNIMPQSAALNTGIWADMENKVQGWARDDKFRRVLYAVKGGTIDDNNIRAYTATGMVVPKYFFMALLCEDDQGNYKAMAFWVEHTSQNKKGDALSKYILNIHQLEEKTGIDFFCNLPDEIEQKVENAQLSEIRSEWKI